MPHHPAPDGPLRPKQSEPANGASGATIQVRPALKSRKWLAGSIAEPLPAVAGSDDRNNAPAAEEVREQKGDEKPDALVAPSFAAPARKTE
ncbi:MAG: hypothetical protein R3D02_03115 [Hyphomicrobiales bacterium]